MSSSFKMFKLFGVDIRLDITWFILVFLNLDFDKSLSDNLINLGLLVMIFGFVMVHEFGHILAAKKYKVNTSKVVISMFGGAAHIGEDMDKLHPKKQLWIVIAGPLTNLVMGVLFFIWSYYSFSDIDLNTKDYEPTSFQIYLLVGVFVNTTMLIFNLLPIYPMDGGRILRSVLELCKVKMAHFISIRITQIFSILLVIVAIYYGLIIATLIAVFFFIMSIVEMKELKEKIVTYEVRTATDRITNDSSLDIVERVELMGDSIANIHKRAKDGTLWRESDYVLRDKKKDVDNG